MLELFLIFVGLCIFGQFVLQPFYKWSDSFYNEIIKEFKPKQEKKSKNKITGYKLFLICLGVFYTLVAIVVMIDLSFFHGKL